MKKINLGPARPVYKGHWLEAHTYKYMNIVRCDEGDLWILVVNESTPGEKPVLSQYQEGLSVTGEWARISGSKGVKGDKGDAGEKGPKGDTGPQGPQGIQGALGPRGLRGMQGVTGLQGPVGPSPAHEWSGTSLAFQLPSGELGQFVDLKGDVGPEGPEGPAGANGQRGLKGDTGPTGPQGAKGDTGPQGPQGLPGPAGPKGDQGPAGEKGATGAQGRTGPQGAPGVGLPSGGYAQQILMKSTNNDDKTAEWVAPYSAALGTPNFAETPLVKGKEIYHAGNITAQNTKPTTSLPSGHIVQVYA